MKTIDWSIMHTFIHDLCYLNSHRNEISDKQKREQNRNKEEEEDESSRYFSSITN